MRFSIIIPTYNEGEDVRLSIESALRQTLPAEEILVVDDSTDLTPIVIQQYAAHGVQYIRGTHTGCCGARNLGMQIARGDVVVLLNADVILPDYFLKKIEKHYEAGADYVLVESQVLNMERVWARFVQAQHQFSYGGKTDVYWTEGFSCRKKSAEDVGWIPGSFPITFCRDWFLGKLLSDKGFKKIVDPSIVVTHKAPDAFREYWKVRKARGRFSSLTQLYLLRRPRWEMFLKLCAKDCLFVLRLVLIIPDFFQSMRVSLRSPRRLLDAIPFYAAYEIQGIARMIGEWEGFRIALRDNSHT